MATGTGVVIVGAARTPLGSFGGALSALSCTQLGSAAIDGALQRTGKDQVEELVMGNVLSAGLGQAPARQAGLGASLRKETCCTTINKVCSSGLKSVAYAAQSIMLGDAQVTVAGGMESMSRVPYYLPMNRGEARYRMGDKEVWDGMIKDGLWDPYDNVHMGNCGEVCAKEFGITREEQDDFAIESLRRAVAAHTEGHFKDEIAPVEVRVGRKSRVESSDEALAALERTGIKEDKIRGLKPAFDRQAGTITAANASTISDGAAALVLMSEDKSASLGLKPLARIIGFADAEQAPVQFPTTPAKAVEKLVQKTKISLDEVDAFEINEAFAAVVIANMKLLKIPHAKVNQFGGACALGHPIGCSGARILVTLLNVLQKRNGRYGIAAICNGGGGATAMLVERL